MRIRYPHTIRRTTRAARWLVIAGPSPPRSARGRRTVGVAAGRGVAQVLDAPERIAALKVDEVIARLQLKPTDVVADLGAGTGCSSCPSRRPCRRAPSMRWRSTRASSPSSARRRARQASPTRRPCWASSPSEAAVGGRRRVHARRPASHRRPGGVFQDADEYLSRPRAWRSSTSIREEPAPGSAGAAVSKAQTRRCSPSSASGRSRTSRSSRTSGSWSSAERRDAYGTAANRASALARAHLRLPSPGPEAGSHSACGNTRNRH